MDIKKTSTKELDYVLNHVFLPPKLPQEHDTGPGADLGAITLCELAYDAAVLFPQYLSEQYQLQWAVVIKMLGHLLDTTRVFEKQDQIDKILNMRVGDALAFNIRAQNAGLLLRKNSEYIVFEAFEVSPPPEHVMSEAGKLLCSYPGPAIEVPLVTSQDPLFVEELVSFIGNMDVDQLDSAQTTTKAGSTVQETRGTNDPKYITQLLIAILHGMGREANVQRITKRIADEVCWKNALNPWRRSPLWLVLRVAAQRMSGSTDVYKQWMLFLHARLLQQFLDNNFSSDILQTARVKTSRRAYKLRHPASPLLLQTVKDVNEAVELRLQERWVHEQRIQAFSLPFAVDPLAIERDTVLSLVNSRTYLTAVLRRDSTRGTLKSFTLNEPPRLRDFSISAIYPDVLIHAVKADPYIALADFEAIVEAQSSAWAQANSRNELASHILKSCIDQYVISTKKHYASNAEDQSRMILTILDLWVALDVVVCAQYPLLRSYSPEIPATILDPLLVRSSVSLNRAAAIARHLRERHSIANANSAFTSIYATDITETSFAVRYFEQSLKMYDLRSAIELAATEERRVKLAQLRDRNEQHGQLLHQIATLDCTFNNHIDRNGYSRLTHARNNCAKCMLKKRAEAMTIGVHEWPLSSRRLEAAATIFELDCPPAFSIWRTMTYQVLRDIGMAHIGPKTTVVYALEDYAGLRAWNGRTTSDRITSASITKSFLSSHYRAAKIPNTDQHVCVNNALNFRLYDKLLMEPAHTSFAIDLHPYCTLLLPDKESDYSHLQYAVSHSTHSHNSTIVKQGDCPTSLSVHEQLAFSNLRCGAQLQWMNIVRELRTKTLTFSREEVHILLMQAAWQIGPLASDGRLRIWHSELEIEGFGLTLIQESADLLSQVGSNWMEGNTVKTLIYLASRLLVSATDSRVIKNGYALLRRARTITYEWMRQILYKLQTIIDKEKTIGELQIRACEIAAICRATFDVDPGNHLSALLSSSSDVAILVECSIVIHDYTPPSSTLSLNLQKLLRRDCRLAHFLESRLATLIRTNRSGLDAAIASVWPTYQPGDRDQWRHLPEPNARWVMSFTNPERNQCSRQVHYNLLSGRLLIDGKPLGRLPNQMLAHSTYQRIFGRKILDVVPANIHGMDYATRHLIHGFQVFFAVLQHDVKHLIIRAQDQSGNIFELIPPAILAKDFPRHFTEDYTHWMNTATGVIEFRPLNRMWEHTSSDWRLDFWPNGASTMSHGEKRRQKLIDFGSLTFHSIANRFYPLEHLEHLTAVLDLDCQPIRILIDLPRFGLSFFLNENSEMESNNMHNMIVDSNQCTGTMIGLRNQLVLRHKDVNFASLPRLRLVIIPHGKVQFTLHPNEDHVSVSIDTDCNSQRQITWYKYDIDTDLGNLVGNFSLTSRLFKIYLHALCSHSLADPLTSQTGTDHALQELQGAGCFSFQELGKADIELLRLIAEISPIRRYYPPHLRAMQITEWSSRLPVLSQHRLFDSAVSKIIDHSLSLSIFPELCQAVTSRWQSRSDPILAARAGRHAIYYQRDIGCSSDTDRRYHSRDCVRNPDAEMEALKTSRLAYVSHVGLTIKSLSLTNLYGIFEKWGTMHGLDPQRSLTYSHHWLSFDLSQQWLSIYESCRKSTHPRSKFTLIFSFAALAFRNEPDLAFHIPVLLACATIHSSLLMAPPPMYTSYNLSHGYEPLRNNVSSIVGSYIFSIESSPAGRLAHLPYEDHQGYRNRISRTYVTLSQRKIEDAVVRLMNQWPCNNPQSPFDEADSNEWFQIEMIMKTVRNYFANCFANMELQLFAYRVSTVLLQRSCTPSIAINVHTLPKLQFLPQSDAVQISDPILTLEMLLRSRDAPTAQPASHKFGEMENHALTRRHGLPIDTSALGNLIKRFERTHTTALHHMYQDRLETSRNELRGQRSLAIPNECAPALSVCMKYRTRVQDRLSYVFSLICEALMPITPAEHILRSAGLWPSISRRTVLELLGSSACLHSSGNWPNILIYFAEAFIEYQHSQRLVEFSLRSEVHNFFKELDNTSFNWSDAKRYPIWLLIQIQGNFITRPLQSQVAHEMISPSSDKNTLLQLNMGEGKSYVIVPLVAAALADSRRLVRVVVLKPLAKQMFQLLVERLSGLPNRRVFYLPFSRDVDVKTSSETTQKIRMLFEECARVGGILVAQPEHILSFRLMVIDRTLTLEGDYDQNAQDLQATQTWLHSASRDILDESDELLHVRYQLIYTKDQQRPLDGSPDRWLTTQKVFDLVNQYMDLLHRKYPEEVELIRHRRTAGGMNFPHFRLLGLSAAKALVSWIARDALNGRLENITFVGLGFQVALRSHLFSFITMRDVDPHALRTVRKAYEKTGVWKGLLVLRGLLAHGILEYSLSSRRWRVDYGLDLKRSLLAVPYRAKDVPSLRSDFGHPDIIVCLTCLTYYYGGLTSEQVNTCFELLNKLDNPSLEYETWVKRGGDSIPPTFRQIIGVNVMDIDTFTTQIAPVFQHNKGVIDFYLSRVVFPKEAKEFPFKLRTTGWDLAESKLNFTTGFSGTNDNSDLLPTSITHSDPVNQLRTNAQVLAFLLQPENDRYLCIQGRNGEPCSAFELLHVLVEEPIEIRVLLDVGAQMLEMTNRQLVEYWLSLISADDVVAGVFFDDEDNLSVLTRSGLVQPLHLSPFIQRLHQCIIYLDDAHTRGTDLKLPLDFRAMVTLGPKVTKDKLVQGCMRMRNLGHGQSIMFCAPPEVDRRIRRLEMIESSASVQVVDILIWAMSNTCTDIKDHIPHFIQQGVHYHKRQAAYSTFSSSQDKNIEVLRSTWLESAAQDLDDMYGGHDTEDSGMMDAAKNFPDVTDRLKMLGVAKFYNTMMAEEQEREVSHEIEEEPHQERTPELPAAVQELHPDVQRLVKCGAISPFSTAFQPLLSPLFSQNLGRWSARSKLLLGTRDFMTTTLSKNERSTLTEYLRPINWIVSHRGEDGTLTLVVMSPYEVNILLEDIRKSRHVRLHVYAPRTSQSMKSFDDLAFYCLPPLGHEPMNQGSLLNDAGYQLSIWAGQLYFDNYEAYLRTCLLLGISSSESADGSQAIERDRFVPSGERTAEMSVVCLFDKSPVLVLQKLLGLRRKGMSFQSTHLGKVLQARLLFEEDFTK
ncbi:hypothetical protein HYPSUDRAFT_138178 [Hypholoma sublateritium FD-334 SS-4]|uniref:ubiquitinyl hydrolase 1 n=1 Tax=Hypholoma sublateritium (strain FD-334 SS-4) TaxID=945553 RepID=A0A0D2P3A0_HYPSF|nr:hypothetical protein HYPSUDRAFT_138178 [Hypholoma sublateritium FD-334 SS-4]